MKAKWSGSVYAHARGKYFFEIKATTDDLFGVLRGELTDKEAAIKQFREACRLLKHKVKINDGIFINTEAK